MSMNVLVLESVGSCVDTEGTIYPMNMDNTPDTNCGVDWVDTSDEWSESLSDDDNDLLHDWLLENNYSVEVDYSDEELMELEFNYNMQLKGIEVDEQVVKETEKEDRKDERTRIQASQQSELIDQRNTGKPPKNFESAGNDIMGHGFDLGSFDPR